MKFKKYVLIVFVVLFSILMVFADEDTRKFDFRTGLGYSFLGTGDMSGVYIENELNYKLSHYLTSSVSFGLGECFSGVLRAAAYLQGNVNLFLSPFKNTGKYDLRVGVGLSLNKVFDIRQNYFNNIDEGVYDVYSYENRSSIGYNIIIEYSYTIYDNYLIGVKLYTQPYENGDINSGISFKFGWHF
jgi:hypothetical protein